MIALMKCLLEMIIMGCKWCLKSNLEMNCLHQCVFCFENGFRTECGCNEINC